MKASKYLEKLRDIVTGIKRKLPFKVEYKNPQLDLEEEENNILVVSIDGSTSEIYRGKKKSEDRLIEYDGNKQMAICSQPLIVGGNQLYFTRAGYYGSQAINKDTLLSGDIYKPSTEKRIFELPKNETDIEQFDDIAEEDYEVTQDDSGNEVYKIEGNYEIGSVESLMGSKVTLKKMNKGQRIRKLLEPSKMDRQRLILSLCAGAGIGYYLAQYYSG